MLSVLPYSRTESSERPFKSYNPPARSTMSFSYPAPPQGQTNTSAPYYPPYPPNAPPSMPTSCMSRQEMTSSMYDYSSQQMTFAGSQSWDYSINNMLKKAEYMPNGLATPLPMQKVYPAKHYTADSTTKPDNQNNNTNAPSNNIADEHVQEKKVTPDDEKDQEPPKKRMHVVAEDMKDECYFDRRKKNNESARRSRDNRRVKEEQIAMRVIYLEQENLQLRTEVSLLKADIDKLRCMLYNS